MDIYNSFLPMLQVFSVTMTALTYASLMELMAGCIFAPRQTIMGMLRAGGVERHHSAFHRIFATAV